jgi:serine/threonine-protein kinase RsbW
VIAAHANGSMKGLCDELYASVRTFADSAPQEDDMTVVLVKRAEGSARGTFKRSIDSLEAIFAFTAETFEREALAAEIRTPVDFALEELFTNVVKYGNRTEAPVHIEMTRLPAGVEVTLVEEDALPFDPTHRPPVDITLPIEERIPGGMGLHLVSKLVDAWEYRYDDARREGLTTFRKSLAPADKGGG